MILAAGLGTRLRPLTDHSPKALIDVGGVPMLERVATRLIDAGVDRLIINVHHHADRIRRFVDERAGFGVDVRISHEADAPLETGGGLRLAAPHFRRDAPFFLHNVDIVTGIPLDALHRDHRDHRDDDPLATLAVSGRPSSRLLRFDDHGLQGRVDTRRAGQDADGAGGEAGAEVGTDGAVEAARPAAGPVRDRAFSGVHVIAPRIFDLMEETGAFSIIDVYMRLAAAGHRIRPYDIGDAPWLEIGTPARLEAARRAVAEWGGSGGGGGG